MQPSRPCRTLSETPQQPDRPAICPGYCGTFQSASQYVKKPTVFRTIDALRIFDLVYVLTEGGFGTESLNYMTYQELFRKQNFGFGSSLAVITFLYILIIAIIYIKLLGNKEEERA